MSVEDRKKERIKKVLDGILDSNPVTAIARRVNKKALQGLKLLKGKLTEKKELDLDQLIKDLKSEEKLSKEITNKRTVMILLFVKRRELCVIKLDV
jgi:hypothetical protein